MFKLLKTLILMFLTFLLLNINYKGKPLFNTMRRVWLNTYKTYVSSYWDYVVDKVKQKQ